MHPHPLARLAALAAAGLTGLGLCWLCLGTAQAQGLAAPAAATTWFVDNAPGDGLVGYWKFDQVTGTTTLNSAQLTDTTTLTNGASLTGSIPLSVTAPDFSSLELDGVNDAAIVNDAPALDVSSSSFSVAAWVRRVFTGTHTADLIYDSGTQAGHWYFGFLSNNKLTFTTNGLVDYSSTFTVTDSNWHHVAAVVIGVDGGPRSLTLYLDGAPSPSISAVITTTPSGPKLIGNKNGSFNTPFGGEIDDLRLYNRALSAAEVGRLAAGGGCVTTGTSWASAFGDLQCALVAAQAGDQVWVAGGTYRPGTAPTTSFRVSGKSLSVLGGFNGTETSPAQRPAFDPNAPLTILSGDAAGDDGPNFANYADNTCGVVTASSGFPGLFALTLDGLAIEDGHADCSFPFVSSGGGLAILANYQVTLSHVLFKNNEAIDDGGGLWLGLAGADLSALTFVGNRAHRGGGLSLGVDNSLLGFLGGPVNIAGSVFESNQAHHGGGLFASNGFTVTGSTFLINTAEEEGGGVAIDISTTAPLSASVLGSTFQGNQASEGGGLLAVSDGGPLALTANQDHFTDNTADHGTGGALGSFAVGTGQIVAGLSGDTFSDNQATADGGAVGFSGGPLTVVNGQFTHNTSQGGNGGAVADGHSDAAGDVFTATNTFFSGNLAAGQGGAVSVFGALALSGGSLSQNRVFQSDVGTALVLPVGGGVFVSGTASISGTSFLTNTASVLDLTFNNLAGGGGLAVIGTLAVTNSVFQDNLAAQGGGLQVLAESGPADIQHSLFQGNKAGQGGGLAADGTLLLVNNRLIDNDAFVSGLSAATPSGGGLFLQNGGQTTIIANNLFASNHAFTSTEFVAPHGSALMVVDGFLTAIGDNTVVDSALNGVPAISVSGTTTALTNNIIASHTVAIEALGGTTIVDYNLFSGDTLTHTGVISDLGHSRVAASAQFVAPGQDNFHLRLDSPAIDAGDNEFVQHIVTRDLDGGPRLADVHAVPDTGAGTPPIVDIGAFELNDDLFLPLVQR